MVLLVAYDLHNPGRDYDEVVSVIKAVGMWAHPQGSVWFVDTQQSPSQLRDSLKAAGDPNDEYFVVRLHQNWAAFKLDGDVAGWLKSNNRSW